MTAEHPENPYTDPTKLATRITEVQTLQATHGAVDGKEDSNPTVNQRALLNGVSVLLRFEETPPPESIPITGHAKSLGYLLFITQKGDIIKVPNIWQNQTWKSRMEEYQQTIDEYDERKKSCEQEIKRLKDLPNPNKLEKTKLREAKFRKEEYEKNLHQLNRLLNHTRAYAHTAGCPATHPIPELPN